MASASKYAVLSVDLEDWYHLDYLRDKPCDRAYSMLDGLDEYRRILESHDRPSSFFVVGEIAQSLSTVLRELADAGHDVLFSYSRSDSKLERLAKDCGGKHGSVSEAVGHGDVLLLNDKAAGQLGFTFPQATRKRAKRVIR